MPRSRDDQTFGAIEAYSGAIALRPDSMLAHLRRGETYQRRGDPATSTPPPTTSATAAALDPTATRPLEELGDVLYQLQRYAARGRSLRARLRLDDRSARVSYKLALARYRDGDVDGAIAALNDALQLNDRMADAYYLLGLCLREQHAAARGAAGLRASAWRWRPGLIAGARRTRRPRISVARPPQPTSSSSCR